MPIYHGGWITAFVLIWFDFSYSHFSRFNLSDINPNLDTIRILDKEEYAMHLLSSKALWGCLFARTFTNISRGQELIMQIRTAKSCSKISSMMTR